MLRFKLFGMEVRIDFLFVALITVFLLTDSSGVSVIGLTACILHELAHVVVFYAVGFTPSLLAFELAGVRLQKPSRLLPRGKEFLVLIAGSGINLIIFTLLWLRIEGDVPLLISGAREDSAITLMLMISHLAVGVYNLIPLKGLDGGKLLSMMFGIFLPDRAVNRICEVTDITVLAMLIAGCVYVFFQSGASFTLFVMFSTLCFMAVTRFFGNGHRHGGEGH